jgi:hypothetical protein
MFNGSADEKILFHSEWKRNLKKFAKTIGLNDSDYEVRSQKGGPAILGEVVLHTSWFYVMVGEPLHGGNQNVMYRTCESMKDYVGGSNNWASASEIGGIVLPWAMMVMNERRSV